MIVVKKNLRGFTFVEVMMVMAIIGIMAGMVVVSFTKNRVERELETNAREFAGVVREAQNYALTGKQFVAGTDPCGFMVNWDGSSYTLTYKYKGANEVCNQTSLIATYALKNGVSFSGSNADVYFDVPHATLNFNGIKSVQFTKSSKNHTVCIYADGRISDQPGINCP